MRRKLQAVPSDDGADAAIAHVLSCEREAQDALEAARRAAETSTLQARSRARTILERAQMRIATARHAVERRIAQHEADASARIGRLSPGVALTATDLERLDAAAWALARELTGGGDG